MTIRASFVGRLTRDAEFKTIGENQVCNFSVASDSGYGEKKLTQFVDCALWGHRGEKIHNWLLKGKQVVVYGDIGSREYDKKDGSKGFTLTCRVTDLEFVGKKEDDAYKPNSFMDDKATTSKESHSYSSETSKSWEDDEIPF